MSAPPLPALLWQHWQPSWTLDALGTLAALAYVGAAARAGNWPRWRSVAFLGGIACVLAALQSGIDAYGDRMLSDHMVQHLLLLELAPLLLLAGRPGILLVRAAPRARRRTLVRSFVRLAPLTHPLVCLGVLALVVGLMHLPSFYDAALRHAPVHDLEHGLYLLAGTLMWWPILDGDPVAHHRLDGVARLAYMIAAMLPMTLLGAFLNRQATLVYPAYAPPARGLGISAVVDQQQAGAIMWVLGSTLMVLAGLWQAMAALVAEERRQQARDRRDVRLGPVRER
jgi:cytochrome c oxidase assembly factor CtaG